jgi:4-hydroxy-tetrahydrodipicolinate reductase
MSGASPVPVIVSGAAGRMGRTLIGLALGDRNLLLAGALESPQHPDLGTDAGTLVGHRECGVRLSDRLDDAALVRGAVLIEFSSPDASLAHLRVAARVPIAAVVGTTGFTAEQQREIEKLSGQMACMQASNMSVGVTMLLHLVEQAARQLGPAFDIEVLESHHRLKKDAPSGTALSLARAAAAGRGAALEDWAIYGREGMTGERPDEQIGILALRGGDVVGDHTVFFYGTGERIELTHRAQSRHSFASGALRAAAWIAGRPPGLYSMRDVLFPA